MSSNKIPTKEREFVEVEGGEYDDDGFYTTPNGSKNRFNIKGFWDPEGYYFNRHGFDVNGGYYDGNGEYIEPTGNLVDDYADDEDDFYNEEEYRKFQETEKYNDDGYDEDFDEEALYNLDINKGVEEKKVDNKVNTGNQQKIDVNTKVSTQNNNVNTTSSTSNNTGNTTTTTNNTNTVEPPKNSLKALFAKKETTGTTKPTTNTTNNTKKK